MSVFINSRTKALIFNQLVATQLISLFRYFC